MKQLRHSLPLQGRENEHWQTTREQLRHAPRSQEELYNFAPISLITLDRRGMILDLNDRAAQLLSSPAGWLRQRPFLAFIARDDIRRFLRLLSRLRLAPGHETAAVDLVIERHVVPVELWIGSWLRGDQVMCGLAIVEVTETRTVEEQLRETLSNWHSL